MACGACQSLPTDYQIPIDYTITKGCLHGELSASDSTGNLVYRVDTTSSKCSFSSSGARAKTLLDASGTPLMSLLQSGDGQWQGFKGNSMDLRDLIFTGQATLSSLFHKELDVLLVGGNSGQMKCSFILKGNPFQRSCTMYFKNTIVSQSSLNYKLRKSIVSRSRFRLTIFPGIDHTLILAMLVIFFW